MSDSPSVCSVCNERGHSVSKCPELKPDFSNGFYKPAGGYRDDDDDDEHMSMFEYYFGMKLVWSKWL